MNKKIHIGLLLLMACFFTNKMIAQHFVGVQGGYSINTMSSSIYEDFSSVGSWKNYGFVYRYYTGEWLGIQAGVNYTEKGYQRDSTYKRYYQVLEIPFVTQFHYELWKLRAVANAGLYGAYTLGGNTISLYPGREEVKKTYEFQSNDRRFDYGLRFGGGIGLVMRPVEIMVEFNYSIGFGYVHKPVNIPAITKYNRLSQMIFSVTLLYAF